VDGPLVALWITTSATAVGVIYTIVKNGRSRTKQETELKVELKKDIESIQKSLDDPNDGLGAIRREVSGMKEHCAGITSGFEQRITGLEGDRRDKYSQQ
jgi:hypothetical protein